MSRFGLNLGLELGPQAAAALSSGFAGVTRDALSGQYFPADATEWTTFLAAAGLSGAIAVPNSLHGFQDASGNITDQIGAFPLVPQNGTPAYQQSISGYSRKAVVVTDGVQYLRATSASLPDPATSSYFGLVVAKCAAGTGSIVLIYATSNEPSISAASVNRLRVNSSSTQLQGTGAVLNTVLPFSLRYNKTASTVTGFSADEKLSPAFTAATGKQIQIAQQNAQSTLYAAHWFGANAEISDANYKALLQALGWTITWS
jgi:hypothetical protein